MPKIIVFPFRSYVHSPIGTIEIQATQTHIHSVVFIESDEQVRQPISNELTNLCEIQLSAYFAGTLKKFDLPTRQEGSPFMLEVLESVKKIPYGNTKSYTELAKQAGDENLTRAVGSANGKNKLAIIVPCHRVIGSNGKLTGYAWGVQRKQWLIVHEAKINNTYSKLF